MQKGKLPSLKDKLGISNPSLKNKLVATTSEKSKVGLKEVIKKVTKAKKSK